ncbi:Cytochrome c oxidase subunit 2 precursor [Rhodobacteraceae bacterium THAF1]|uniref:cytochrome c oxidase subunit II n=1 Tax=Palleronia sp. THAF1 TaxID=2587842 RepID=UPI000F3D54D1|nr:cytochrome c oxidase subunit II [Palleronia sp. THAF1]QFU08174.1 Cytochrome c oxidase subunit 2 precursor [Palleronia sp. THAF1]VDC28726.1 Cytochrome c oxidase subunit 2 precursor [Rhodobacteraceae bacterium THAF1]
MKRLILSAAAGILLSGCSGRQSVLAPAGADSTSLLTLFWVMLVGLVVIWLLVNGMMLFFHHLSPRHYDEGIARKLIVGGGIVFPTVVIAALLAWGLSMMPDQRAPGSGLRVEVMGEQWWWRVAYLPEGADAPVISANEIRLPVGQRTTFQLSSAEVIHSFWIPALGGKMDMFPGRETILTLEPTQPGTFRGQCAEFCGASHALMAFEVVTMEPDDFAAWLEEQAAPAVAPDGAAATRGAIVFAEQGCGACHAVRGTPAVGQVGPDLTHVGSRLSIGAGILAPTAENFAAWIDHTGDLKPEVDMPAYDDLPEADLTALATYLEGLK